MKYTTYKSNACRNLCDLLVSAAIIACTVVFFALMPTWAKVLCVILSVLAALIACLAIDGLLTRRSVLAIVHS